MSYRPVLFLACSVFIAITLLAGLLLVATSPYTDRIRQISHQVEYLQAGADVVQTAVQAQVRSGQLDDFDTQLNQLDEALLNASTAMQATLQSVYASEKAFDQLRWHGVHILNWQDVDAHLHSAADTNTDLAAEIVLRVENVADRLVAYRSDLAAYTLKRAQFAEALNQLPAGLREAGDQSNADVLYVSGNKISALLAGGGPAELDQISVLISELENVRSRIPTALRGSLNDLINTVYITSGLKRDMHESVDAMALPELKSQLAALAVSLANDQIYVGGAVSDARILLNISTVMLLILLALSGLRLQMSYRALNVSHDDLEERVEARTADLAQANEDLKESQVQLVQAEKMSSLGQLVAGVMHEINTPLLYVQNNTTTTAATVAEITEFVDLVLPLLEVHNEVDLKRVIADILKRRETFSAQDLKESLQEIDGLANDSVEGLGQISELVQSLKDFSRLDRVQDDKFDVTNGLEKTLVITRNMLKQGVEVVRDFQALPEIYCSPSRINQIFINIVTNAVQAMDGQGTLTIRTRALKHADGDSVEVIFEDTGCGIAAEHLDKIMDPFFTTKPVGQGTGLGLSIVRQIVEQHQGQILIDSVVGKGTRITLNFPVKTRRNTSEEAA